MIVTIKNEFKSIMGDFVSLFLCNNLIKKYQAWQPEKEKRPESFFRPGFFTCTK